MRRALALAFSVFSLSCSSTPPPGWAHGGAPLVLGQASWSNEEYGPIELRPDGKVFEDGDLLFTIDRAGRVFDEDNESIAVLLPDGQLGGNDDASLGHVGLTNAAPPGRGTAWLSVLPDGRVVFFDDDGERLNGGAWRGCQGPVLRTCTLVTHLVVLGRAVAAARSGVSVGVGIGVWH